MSEIIWPFANVLRDIKEIPLDNVQECLKYNPLRLLRKTLATRALADLTQTVNPGEMGLPVFALEATLEILMEEAVDQNVQLTQIVRQIRLVEI